MKTKKNIAPFAPLSDDMSIAVIKEDIKAIADPKGFEGKNKNLNTRHCGQIYAGTENLTAFVGDGRIVEENVAKKNVLMAGYQKKNSFPAIAFNMDGVRELAKKFPETEYAWSLVPAMIQMSAMRVQIKKEVPVTFRAKARTFKDLGIKGDISATEKIDGMQYSFAPDMQEMGLKIRIKKK